MRMLRGRKRTADNPDLATETQEEFDARYERNRVKREAAESTEKRAGVERRKTARADTSDRRRALADDSALADRERAYALRNS